MHVLTRSALVVGSTLALTAGLVAPAAAAPASDPVRPAHTQGLFGTQDPTFDGVYRQSFAILGLTATRTRVPAAATAWLLAQQCAEGSFTAYRADTSIPCPPGDPTTFTGQDTNATAAGALALRTLGRTGRADRATEWLLQAQTRGGGWPWFVGGKPDSISTALVMTALAGVPGTRAALAAGERFLRRHTAGCAAPIDERFGVSFQADYTPDPLSTTQSLLGLGRGLPVTAQRQQAATATASCGSAGLVTDTHRATARWTARTLVANGGTLPSAYEPGATDWNATALGVLGLVAARSGGRATDLAVAALESGVEAYVADPHGDRPAALGTLLLVAHATGTPARNFGGANLPTRLLATLQG